MPGEEEALIPLGVGRRRKIKLRKERQPQPRQTSTFLWPHEREVKFTQEGILTA